MSASGLLNSKETAQEYVLTGVGLLAGSTILLLTVIWGTCVILGNIDFGASRDTSSVRKPFQRLRAFVTGCGITTDLETSFTARIMVLSVIPFIIIQIPELFSLSTGQRIVILTTLVISVIFLLVYFLYQIFRPWIQIRRLEFVKHEHLIIAILKHVQQHSLGSLLTDDGAPNIPVIRMLFEELDHDSNNCISPSELKQFLREINFKSLYLDKDKAVFDILKEFDLDTDQKISKEEFVNGFSKWLNGTKLALEERSYSGRSLYDLRQIFHPWIQKKREEFEMKKQLVEAFITHLESSALGSLLKADGTPDIDTIRSLFEKIDTDGDNQISQKKLKELVMGIKFGKIPTDVDDAVVKIMEELDTSGDHVISQEEFVVGFAKWLNTFHNQEESRDGTYQKTWEETDKLLHNKTTSVDKSLFAWLKALAPLLLGVVMLSFLAEPLIDSVQNFSKAAELPSFFVAFVLVPLATNARVATSTIKAANNKKPRTTSLTFSEIYSGVFMNNILGFSVLLSLIYWRDLSWNFSAEVLIVLIVCTIVGLIASFRSTFPVWMSFLSFFLYPLSLLLVYILEYVL